MKKFSKMIIRKSYFLYQKLKTSIELIDKALALGEMLSETDFTLIIKPHPDYPLNQNHLKK